MGQALVAVCGSVAQGGGCGSITQLESVLYKINFTYNAICIVWAKEEVPETSLSPWVVAVI